MSKRWVLYGLIGAAAFLGWAMGQPADKEINRNFLELHHCKVYHWGQNADMTELHWMDYTCSDGITIHRVVIGNENKGWP